MADPLTGLLQKKKQTEAQAASSTAKPAKGLFDFDVESTLSRKPAFTSGGEPAEPTIGERIFQALAAGSNVDFPTVTEICDRVAKEPREVPEAVRLLAGAFAEKGGLPRRKLKALTIMNELLYDKRAEAELRQVHGVHDALWTLQTTSNSGLGPEADEQIRMFATEVEKKCFGASGDPFAAPALVPEDPFTLPVVNSVPAPAPLGPLSPAKDSMKDVGSSMLGALWQVGSQMTSAVKATAPRVEIPRFAMRPGASRPNLDVSFEGVLPGEKVHYAFNPSVLLINKPFREVQGRLLISNYRLKFQVPKGTWKDNLAWIGEKQLLDIPLGLIEALELEAPTSQAGAQQWRLVVSTKDFRSIVVLLPTGKDLGEAEEAILALSQPGPAYTSALFAFQHAACLQTGRRDDGWSLFDPRIEFERMEVETSPSSASGCPWLLSSVNSAYKLCDTYPAFLALPRCIKEEELRNVASFRKRGRLPTMSWCGGRTRGFASLWRCSQPTEGLMGNNCQSDEKMLYAIRLGATAGRNRELLVLDLRPRKAAYANKVGGGGFESYSGCRLVFGGIDNVHVVRDAWKKMGQAVANLSNDEVGSWYRDVANSGWYDLIGAIFSCALMIVHEIESHHCNVVIHCSDGWDRTAQVSSVAMLCMDPYYRTVRGLLLLIQKEFCSFGHRFRTRLANGEKPTSEYSPVFLQWLECVYQLLIHFPTAFEFTSDLLLFLAREVLTNRYGTFLTDCERERAEQVQPHTLSAWTAILDSGPAVEYINDRYEAVDGSLRPSPTQVNFKTWEDYWFRHRVHPKEELGTRQKNGGG